MIFAVGTFSPVWDSQILLIETRKTLVQEVLICGIQAVTALALFCFLGGAVLATAHVSSLHKGAPDAHFESQLHNSNEFSRSHQLNQKHQRHQLGLGIKTRLSPQQRLSRQGVRVTLPVAYCMLRNRLCLFCEVCVDSNRCVNIPRLQPLNS